MQNQNSLFFDDLLQKNGIRKGYFQGDVVFVKLDNDKHHWPAKISSFFLQENCSDPSKKQQSQDQFNPNKMNKKVKKPKNQRKLELIYKVRYFQWQLFAYVTQQQIKPFSIKFEKQVKKIKDKKLQKAIDRARTQMKTQQRMIIENQQKKTKQKNQNRLSRSCMYIKQESNSSFTTQAEKMDKKHKKKQKTMQKQTIRIKRYEGEIEKRLENTYIEKIHLTQQIQKETNQNQPIIKQQYNSYLIQKKSTSNNSSQNDGTLMKQQYILDNVLFKNKFQILGILSDLLQEFLCKILWLDTRQSIKLSISQEKRINTLNKVLQAQIFKFQQLSQSKCLQKMLNIIKIGQLTNFIYKIYQITVKKKLNKTYLKIVHVLKRTNYSEQYEPILPAVNNQSLTIINTLPNYKEQQPRQTTINSLQFDNIHQTQTQESLQAATSKISYQKKDYLHKLDKLKQSLHIDYSTQINISQ